MRRIISALLFSISSTLAFAQGAQPLQLAPGAPDRHIVVQGDTLWSIAQRFGTSVEALMQVNGLSDAGLLLVGQRLVLP